MPSKYRLLLGWQDGICRNDGLRDTCVGDLLLADRYYCTFAIIALLQAKGIPELFPLHANKKADFRLGSKLGAKDHLVDMHNKIPRQLSDRSTVQ